MLKILLIQILYVFVLQLLVLAMAKRNFRLEIETISCKQNSSLLFANMKCVLRRDKADNITKISMFINLLQQVDEFYIHYTMHFSRNNMPRLKVMDINVNACDFLKTIHKQKLFQVFLKKLKSILNVVPRCPLKAPFNYTITDYYLDVNQLPPQFPAGGYRVHYSVHYRGTLVATILSTGRIVYG